ncbi:MAG: hypothetical protein JNL38_30975 [Myxococcales bacterium]|jgi:hypothetical protein|nr:hypothetical protein [Myxococcales bacterium]
MRTLLRSLPLVVLAFGLATVACVGDDPVATGPLDAGGADASSAPPDAASADAAVPTADAGPDACALEPPVKRTAAGDTFLLDEGGNCNPATRYGGSEVVNVGLSDTSVILLRFDLGADLAARVARRDPSLTLTLVVERLATHPACSGPCPFKTGRLHVFPVVGDWDEGTSASYTGAAWCQKRPNVAWSVPGAAGAADRGPLVGGVDLTASTGAAIAIPVSDVGALAPWLSGTTISFAVTAVGGARVVVASREDAGGARAAALTAAHCR